MLLNIYYCQQIELPDGRGRSDKQKSSGKASSEPPLCLPPMAVKEQLQFFSNGPLADSWISYANITDLVDRALRANAGVSLPAAMDYVAQGAAGLVVYAQKLSYPYAATYYTANATSQSLIFAVPVYTGGGIRLVLAHDGVFDCPGYDHGDLSTRIVKSLYYYASSSNAPAGVVLDAGIGSGRGPKSVPHCGECKGSACVACYVDLPLDAGLAVIRVYKESRSPRGPSTAVIAVLFVPRGYL